MRRIGIIGLLMIGWGQGYWIELLYPRDRDTIRSVEPVFMWMPVVPWVGGVRYEIRIVESYEEPTQSISFRVPYVRGVDLWDTRFVYPVSVRPLERGRWYAWQVIAYAAERVEPLGYSEVYSFYVADGGRDTIRVDSVFPYIEVSGLLEGKYVYVVRDEVYLSVEEPLNVEVVGVSREVGRGKGKGYRGVERGEVQRVKGAGSGRRYLYALKLGGTEEGVYEVRVETGHGVIRFFVVRANPIQTR